MAIPGLSTIISTIRNAVYGKDMREAIARGFELIPENQVLIDKTLKLSDYAADAKIVGDRFAEVKKQMEDIDSGLSTEEKDAFLAYFAKQVEIHPELKETYQVIYDMWRPPVQSVKLDRTSLNMAVGMSITLRPIIEPDNAYDKTGVWTVEPDDIVQCINGTVFAMQAGDATVTFTTNSKKKTASCAINVTQKQYHSITRNLTFVSIDNTDDSIIHGEPYTATLTPIEDYQFSNVTVTMSGNNITNLVFSKDTGVIYIPSVTGDVVITAVAADVIYYKVTYDLDGCSVDPKLNEVEENTTLEFTITPTISGHMFSDYHVRMGNVDITDEVATNENDVTIKVKIVSVTGDVNVVAAAGLPPDLEHYTWEKISEISKSGKAADYFAVGDTKNITLNGTIGTLTLNNLEVSAFIIGINHNSELESNNLIHFQIGKISGKIVGFYDEMYDHKSNDNTHFIMKPNLNTDGAWTETIIRTSILGNNSSPSSPIDKTFLSAMPIEVRNVMRSCTKHFSDNSLKQQSSSDWLSLLGSIEMVGDIYSEHIITQERSYQKQYDYYASGNAKIAYKYDSVSEPLGIWLRSISKDAIDYNYCIYSGAIDQFSDNNSNFSNAISPIFFV